MLLVNGGRTAGLRAQIGRMKPVSQSLLPDTNSRRVSEVSIKRFYLIKTANV